MNRDNFKLILPFMDIHVAGEPFRLVMECPFRLEGKTMFENKLIAQEKIDNIRKLLMMKPRGYMGMYGGFLLPPTEGDSDYGVLFMHYEGYSNMCGHGALAVARALYELYPEEIRKKEKGILVDVPSGQIRLFCNLKGDQVESVSLINRPSFVCALEMELFVPEIGRLHIDIAFAGGYMVYINAEEIGVRICTDSISEMLLLADRITTCVLDKVDFVHPEIQDISMRKCGFCVIFTDSIEEKEGHLESRSFTVYGRDLFDYSPTGTGTAGRLAILEKKGILPDDGIFQNYGISGESFTAEVIERTRIGEYDAIVPKITGQAYITGRGEMLLENGDPIEEGIAF